MRLLLAFIAIMICTAGTKALAQPGQTYCLGVKNTADILDCTNRYNETVQTRLKETFETVLNSLDEEEKAELQQAQKSWLSYRDEECALETKKTRTKSLERINELACLARLSENRKHSLMKLMEENTHDPMAQIASIPRWMNILIAEHPDIYWQFGQTLAGDLNCDGEAEIILNGLQLPETETSPPNMVIAVTSRPITGRPNKTLVFAPLQSPSAKNGNETGLCQNNIKLSLQNNETANPENQETECKILQITNAPCQNYTLRHSENSYKLTPETTP